MNKLNTPFILLTLFFLNFSVRSQSLSNENFRYQYDPECEIKFNWHLSKNGAQMFILWNFSLKTSRSGSGDYFLKWERRESYTQRQGKAIYQDSLSILSSETKSGKLTVGITKNPWLLVLKITRLSDSRTWIYAHIIEDKFPVNGLIKTEDAPEASRFIKKGKTYHIKSNSGYDSLFVYFYKKIFPSAYPPFSKSIKTADPVILHDSTFVLVDNAGVNFKDEGLYLIQSDTLSAEGFSFRVTTPPFPKYNRVNDLIPPLIFVLTKEEFIELENSKNDKAAFDKIILSITKDKGRAKRFIRSYYSRVELANKYFTSFKEGWKTDRGMVYIIFGLPDQVRFSDQSEIWYYKNTRTKFVFVKRGSLYDPNYYVLRRDAKFTELWYSTVNLWRKSRF